MRDDGACDGSLGADDLNAMAAAVAKELMWCERSELREHGETAYFVDVKAPAPRLICFGAVDVSVALCRVTRVVGWHSFVVDPRSRLATRERFPDAERVTAGWPEAAIAQIGGLDRTTRRSHTRPQAR